MMTASHAKTDCFGEKYSRNAEQEERTYQDVRQALD